jgi:soluble lytic murein transglycosylase
LAKDGLLQAASAYTRVGKHPEAISRYRRYIDRYPEDERVDRAYLNIIDIYRDQGEETAALRNAAAAQKVFRGKVGEAQALFAEARIHISVEDWEKALESLERLAKLNDLGGARVPGGTTRAEVDFMRAYMLEQLRRYREAIEGYIGIPDGREQYYGWLASKRLRLLTDNELAAPAIEARLNAATGGFDAADPNQRRRNLHIALRLSVDPGARERILEALKRTYSETPEYADVPTFEKLEVVRPEADQQNRSENGKGRHDTLGRKLFFIGLYDEAAPELEAGGEMTGDDGRYMLAEIYRRGDRADRAIAFMEPLWQRVPEDFHIELMPDDAVVMLYPVPFRDAAKNAAVPRNVDPRFLMSIARQESRFRPDVRSAAAARGMMQFIGTTADRIANELGVSNFDHDTLYDPDTALLFGAEYMNELLVMFPNQPDAAAASYNGGEDNVRRWLKRSNSNEPERYVPEIAYSQTKDYVYKIMANYRVYRFFYDAELSLKPNAARAN